MTNQEIIENESGEFSAFSAWQFNDVSKFMDLARTDEQAGIVELPQSEHFRGWLNKYFKILAEPSIWVSKSTRTKYSTRQLLEKYDKAYPTIEKGGEV